MARCIVACELGAIDLDGMFQVVDIIIGVVNIYFHFQLLTNLASIATKYQSADDELDAKLLRYRTLQTVMLTAVIIVGYLAKWLPELVTVVSIGMIIIYLIAGIRNNIPTSSQDITAVKTR